MPRMATKTLVLKRRADGYYRTEWYDDAGKRWGRSFGCQRAAAHNQFTVFRRQWEADARLRNPGSVVEITVRELGARYDVFAQGYYRRADGTSTREAEGVAAAYAAVVKLYGDLPAAQMRPLLLKTVREDMIAAGLSLGVINRRLWKVRRVFRWGAEEELIPGAVWYNLRAVTPLKPGRCAARVTEKVRPVPDGLLWPVVQVCTPMLAAMIRIQLRTGMRPGELCALRTCDIDRREKVWIYRPVQHKTLHHGKVRTVLIGPQAQAALTPYLQFDTQAFVFSPRKAVRERNDACGTHRHQPVAIPATGRRVGERYDTHAYAKAIMHACRRAFPVPDGITGDDRRMWIRDHHWSPNQLRHNAGTEIRKYFGLDVAQVVLGHSKASVTEVYAEVDIERAAAVIEKIG